MRLSILIVNYNGLNFIRECLDSVQLFAPNDSETIVVDNASSDRSDFLIEREYPWVKLIRSSKNIGFVGGNNLAASTANGKSLLLLNNDTIIKCSLEEVLSLIESNQMIGAVGCRLLNGELRLQESIGKNLRPIILALSWSAIPIFSRTVSRRSINYRSKCFECDWVSGAFMITRHSFWVELNGLDDQYFMYMEDVDYCNRLRSQGKKVVYSSLCTIIHFEGSGRPWIGERALLNTLESYSIYIKKHNRLEVVLTWFLLIIILSLRSILYFSKWKIFKSKTDQSKFSGYSKGVKLIINKCLAL